MKFISKSSLYIQDDGFAVFVTSHLPYGHVTSQTCKRKDQTSIENKSITDNYR